MKIAYLARGEHIWDKHLLEKMVECGHEPHFITYYPQGKAKFHSYSNWSMKGVKNYYCYDAFMKFFPKFTNIQYSLHLRKLLKLIQPDILHTGWIPDMGFIGALSGFHPVVSMPFGSDVLLRPSNSLRSKWKTQFTLKRADMIYCDCQFVKKKIIELIGCSHEKVFVLPQCKIDSTIFRYVNMKSAIREDLGWNDKEVLIMTRKFLPIYGVEYFIEALPDIIQQRPNVRVIFVGTGPLEQSYRNRISELGLGNYIHFAGWVDQKKMADYLNVADIYVNTSLSDGTSCSMLEAMACGLPVVVSDVPSCYEWVNDGNNGFIIPCKDSTTLAKRIIYLLENRALMTKMGKINIKIVKERADFDKNFTVIEDIYKKLVGLKREKNVH